MRISLLIAALAVQALAVVAPAQTIEPDRRVMIDPEIHAWFPMAWRGALPAEMSRARFFGVHMLNLYGATPLEGGGVAVHRVRLLPAGIRADSVADVSAPGLPADFDVVAAAMDSDARAWAVAGTIRGNEHLQVYRTRIVGEGELQPWEALPDLPAPVVPADLLNMECHEGHVLVMNARLDVNNAPRVAGWMGGLTGPLDTVTWAELPPTEKFRSGGALLSGQEVIMLVGGRRYSEEAEGGLGVAASDCDLMPLSPPQIGNWHGSAQTLLDAVPQAVGASFGMGLYVADRQPVALLASQPTSATLQVAFDWRQGSISPWKTLVIDAEPAPVLALAVDPAHNRLLLFEERTHLDAPLMMSSHVLPDRLQASVPTRDELLERRKRESAVSFPDLPFEQSFEHAREAGAYLLVYLAEDDQQSVDVRYALASNQFRYLSQGIAQSFFAGSSARELAGKYEVKAMPAFLLVDPRSDQVVTRVEGSIPSAQQFFRLTSPARQPAAPAAANGDTGAP